MRCAHRAAWLFLIVIPQSAILVTPTPAYAELPAFLRKKSSAVEDGNEKLAAGDAKGALADYDAAASKLPGHPAVALNRGIALLKQGELDKAREAFTQATKPDADPEVRAAAYQNLALGAVRQAEALASQDQHAEAQKLFQEAVDAGKRSLRLQPGNTAAAWNLELAARRLREEEQKQKAAEEERKKQEQEQENEPKDQGGEHQDQPQDGNPDQSQDQEQAGDPSQAQKPEPKHGEGQDSKPKPEDAQKNDAKKNDAPKPGEPKPEKKPDAAQSPEPREDQSAGEKDAAEREPLPAEIGQALDALEDGEENFERVRARQRGAAQRRAPEKDW